MIAEPSHTIAPTAAVLCSYHPRSRPFSRGRGIAAIGGQFGLQTNFELSCDFAGYLPILELTISMEVKMTNEHKPQFHRAARQAAVQRG